VTGLLHAFVEDAAREAGCTVAQMVGPIRERPIVAARHEAMARAYASGFSTVQIGTVFARDHSTVIHAIRRNRPVNGLPYYKRYPRDFIEGTIGMAFELKGAYGLVLDLIYMQGGKLPDDARYISGLLGCTVRKWTALRDGLVSAGKIQPIDGYLTNYRAVSELETLAKLQDKQRENASGPRKTKDLQKPRLHHTEPEPDREETKVVSSLPRKRVSPKTRINPDAIISPEMRAAAEARGLSDAEAEAQFAKFRDWSLAKGQTYADWLAAWRNWITSPHFKPITKGPDYAEPAGRASPRVSAFLRGAQR
jgi:uncharacterized protein YdaU (DUF1376 family)